MCVLSSTLAGAHCTACDADHDAHENELNRLGAQRRGVVGLLDRREPTRAHHGARWRTRKQDHQGVHGHVRMFMGMCVCFPASCLCSLDCGGRCSQSRCDGAATRCCIDTVCASACLHLRRQARAHVQPVATCDALCLAGWPCLHSARCLRHSTRSIARLLHVHDTHTPWPWCCWPQVLGKGFEQFYDPLMVGERGLFSCVFADVNDGSKNKTSSPTGVVAETGLGSLIHYRVPCAVPDWPPAWTQETKVAVHFRGTSLVAYVCTCNRS